MKIYDLTQHICDETEESRTPVIERFSAQAKNLLVALKEESTEPGVAEFQRDVSLEKYSYY